MLWVMNNHYFENGYLLINTSMATNYTSREEMEIQGEEIDVHYEDDKSEGEELIVNINNRLTT